MGEGIYRKQSCGEEGVPGWSLFEDRVMILGRKWSQSFTVLGKNDKCRGVRLWQ